MNTQGFTKFFRAAALTVAATAMLAACAAPKVTSYTDPNYRAQGPQKWRVAVLGVDMSLGEQQALERQGVASFNEAGVDALRGMNVLHPTKEYSRPEAFAELSKAGAEVLLEITALDRQKYDAQTPGSFSLGFSYTQAYRDSNGNTFVIQNYVPGRYYSGYSYTKSDATYRARLINLTNGDVMWQGDATIKGAGSKFETNAEGMAEATVRGLIEDGIVAGTLPN